MPEPSRDSWDVKYELTEDDIAALSLQISRPTGQKLFIISFVIVIVYFPTLSFIWMVWQWLNGTSNMPSQMQVLYGLIGFVVVMAVMLNGQRAKPRGKVAMRTTQQTLKRGHGSAALGWMVMQMDERGYATANRFGEESSSWAVIWKIEHTATHAFVFINPQLAYIVPARAFESPQEFDAFTRDIQLWRERALPYGVICPVCGYDLRGHDAPGCPECGWGHEDPELAAAQEHP